MTVSPRGEGEAWVTCALGHRHWGVFGAAGLLASRSLGASTEILLQHRATWSHHGGTWGLLGGARQRGEPAVAAALREAGEEAGVRPEDVRVHATFDDDHGGWSYSTAIAAAGPDLDPQALNAESIDVAWWPVQRLPEAPLHPGFAAVWPRLAAALEPLQVIVDAANVVGSRPDGWWRDRSGAAEKLMVELSRLAARGLSGAELPPALAPEAVDRWWPQVTAVLEGAARAAAPSDAADITVLNAPGQGDEALVTLVGSLVGPRLVVTADRELRQRCQAAGAAVVGPRWLLDLLPGSTGEARAQPPR